MYAQIFYRNNNNLSYKVGDEFEDIETVSLVRNDIVEIDHQDKEEFIAIEDIQFMEILYDKVLFDETISYRKLKDITVYFKSTDNSSSIVGKTYKGYILSSDFLHFSDSKIHYSCVPNFFFILKENRNELVLIPTCNIKYVQSVTISK